jgi:hypothetical protein
VAFRPEARCPCLWCGRMHRSRRRNSIWPCSGPRGTTTSTSTSSCNGSTPSAGRLGCGIPICCPPECSKDALG